MNPFVTDRAWREAFKGRQEAHVGLEGLGWSLKGLKGLIRDPIGFIGNRGGYSKALLKAILGYFGLFSFVF